MRVGTGFSNNGNRSDRDLLADPTIKNMYIGDHPNYWMEPGVPHDAYLGEFLMRTKTVIRD